MGGVNPPRGFESHPLRSASQAGAWRRHRGVVVQSTADPPLPCPAWPMPRSRVWRRRTRAAGWRTPASRTPAITSGRWLRAGSARTSRTLPAAPALGSAGAEDDGGDAGEDDRAGAHRAGLEGDVEGRAGQAPAAERLGGGADREDLGVGGRVAAQLALVAGGGEQLAVAEDRGADRDVAVGLGQARLLDRGSPSPAAWEVASASAFIGSRSMSPTTSPASRC